jgi:hypothetical protein
MHTDDDGQEYPALPVIADAESFTAVKKAVESARRYGESAEKRGLREAKDAWRDMLKTYGKIVTETNDAELIELETETVADALREFELQLNQQAELSAAADAEAIAA